MLAVSNEGLPVERYSILTIITCHDLFENPYLSYLSHTHTYVRSYFEGVNAEDIVGMATTAYLSLPTVEKRLLRDK